MCLHRTGFVLSLARTIRHVGVCCRYSGKAKEVDGREESKLVHGRSPSPFNWFHRRGVSLSGSELVLRPIFIQHSRGGWVRNVQHMKRSAGILMYRGQGSELEVLLVHPGGPFWAKKDDGAWSIPKGEYDEAEEPLACAIREFEEELGSRPRRHFHRARRDRAAEPQDRYRVRRRRRVRSRGAQVESVRARMAAEKRADAVLPGSRSRRHGSRPTLPRSKFCRDNKALSTGCWLRCTSLGSER